MIRKIYRDNNFLSLPSTNATRDDIVYGRDLLDTLMDNASSCVGMAANMIGVNKAIIAFIDENKYVVMYNPRIIRYYGKKYSVYEGCLSHEGKKNVERYEKIQVQFQNEDFKVLVKTYSGFTAEIIQHEIDHLFGKLI